MSTEILVNIAHSETRAALVEGGAVQEVFVQRAARHGLVGNIYKGRVQRVLPGMQAAFVDIGLERTAFLHAADMRPTAPNGGEAPDAVVERPSIERLLTEGQEVMVQVLKDPLGSKGARLTTALSIPSRYLVLLPYDPHLGVSARIEDDAERARLKSVLERLREQLPAPFGLIVRTAGENAEAEALDADVKFLLRLWKTISSKMATTAPGKMVHGDLPLSMRVLRDLLGTHVERVRIDSAEEFQRLREFAGDLVPQYAPQVELYDGAAPIFDLYGVEDDLNRALQRRVDLKSGGHLVFDQTEAMSTVDVNTGAYVGHSNLEDTVLKTNLEAAQAIARQLRLRNLGGLIIIDFIDMKGEAHRAQVLRALEKELKRDPARSTVFPFSPLGLVEMTRKRTRESLGHILCEPCPACEGRGEVKTAETVCHEILREIARAARQFEAREFRVIAAPSIVERLSEDQSQSLAELEEYLGRPIRLQAETQYARDNFDVVPT